jgi:AraC-like DNA-binding protein
MATSLTNTTRSETAAAHRRAVDRVIQAMHENLSEEFSLEDMADVAIISPYHFNRVFHQIAGLPPCQFLSALRLWQAKRLLLTTRLKVTDICFEVGYNSLGTFTRRFTDLVGVPPQRLRALARSGGLQPLMGKLRAALAAHADSGAAHDGGAEEERDPDAAAADGAAGNGKAADARPGRAAHGVHGRVRAPEGFRGAVFVGLFATPLPQGRPLACTVLAAPGTFHLAHPPDGKHYLFAAAAEPEAEAPSEHLLFERALRGGAAGRLVEVASGAVEERVEIALRPPEPIDPPILLTFPVLLAERLAAAPAAPRTTTAACAA